MSIIALERFEEMSQIPTMPPVQKPKPDKEENNNISTFDKLLSVINNKENYGENPEHFQNKILPIIQTMSIDELLQNDGLLLAVASKKPLPYTVEYLMQTTDEWPKKMVQSCMLYTSENGHDMTLTSLIKNTKHWNAKFFAKLCDLAKDDNMHSTLNKFKNNQIGKNWSVTEDYEIERKNKDIKQVFNFAACHITTIMKEQIIQRNFADFQSDGEITIAYNKLQKFSLNTPTYNGKDTTSHRRVNRTNKP